MATLSGQFSGPGADEEGMVAFIVILWLAVAAGAVHYGRQDWLAYQAEEAETRACPALVLIDGTTRSVSVFEDLGTDEPGLRDPMTREVDTAKAA